MIYGILNLAAGIVAGIISIHQFFESFMLLLNGGPIWPCTREILIAICVLVGVHRLSIHVLFIVLAVQMVAIVLLLLNALKVLAAEQPNAVTVQAVLGLCIVWCSYCTSVLLRLKINRNPRLRREI